jgi:peptidoglycan/LPS O-acetylase OafA/YrhL
VARLPGLDLLRGMAAYMVVVAHCGPALARVLGPANDVFVGFLAISGVELFFALSGFLIGGILLELKPSALNYRYFLARRWLRTLPVYYVALVVFLLLPRAPNAAVPADPWRYVVFLQNVTDNARFFGVSWSLAVEEWFYVLLPLLLLLRMRYLHAVLLFVAFGILARLLLPVDVRQSLLGRADAVAYGCLVAWALKAPWRAQLERHAGLLAAIGAAGMLSAFGALVYLVEHAMFTRPAGAAIYTAMPCFAAFTIPYFAKLEIRDRTLAGIAAFGAAVSYPLYLWHVEVIDLLARTPFHAGKGLLHVVAVLISATAVAYVVHLLIERPGMRARPPMPR